MMLKICTILWFIHTCHTQSKSGDPQKAPLVYDTHCTETRRSLRKVGPLYGALIPII